MGAKQDKTATAGLVKRAQTGDQSAFQRLVELTHGLVYRLALRIVHSPADAEDAVQDVYVRAWQRLDRLRSAEQFTAWVCGIARHVAYDRLRQLGRRRERSADLPGGAGLPALVERFVGREPDPERRLAARQTAEAVWAAVDALKEKHRLVILLREMDGMSYEEMATALGCSLGTVESRLFRARKALSKKLKRVAAEHGIWE